jgi:hypothetical protein
MLMRISAIAQPGGSWASLHVGILSSGIGFGSQLLKAGQGTQVTYDPRDKYPETDFSPGIWVRDACTDSKRARNRQISFPTAAVLETWFALKSTVEILEDRFQHG